MTSWPLVKVISGGQDGADIAGVVAAKALGYRTGGTMPAGFLTERGPRPEYATQFGMVALVDGGYDARTRANVRESEGTLILGRLDSPGSLRTLKLARGLRKPHLAIVDGRVGLKDEAVLINGTPWQARDHWLTDEACARAIAEWILARQIRVLNVAGNRESVYPGIEQRVYDLLRMALRPLEG